ncbi:MmcQ/YjbR family DNA-binding protein [Microbacterium sp.]|uniref:MmcQ/YjbR family DNA-binding protein n=1 Tax=Microbacterium sp. TaxID=51671 RepID=UPI003C76CCA6
MSVKRGLQAEETWNRLVGLATSWPATAATTSYGAPSLKVDGRMFARIRAEADDMFVFVSTPEERRAWLESGEPGLFAEPHYERFGHILADPSATDAAILNDLLDRAWELTAREKTRAARDET